MLIAGQLAQPCIIPLSDALFFAHPAVFLARGSHMGKGYIPPPVIGFDPHNANHDHPQLSIVRCGARDFRTIQHKED